MSARFLIEMVDTLSCFSKSSAGLDTPERIYIPVGSLFLVNSSVSSECVERKIVQVSRLSPLNMSESNLIKNTTINISTFTESCGLAMMVYTAEPSTVMTMSISTPKLATTTTSNRTIVVPAITVTGQVGARCSMLMFYVHQLFSWARTPGNKVVLSLALDLGIPLLLLTSGLLLTDLCRKRLTSCR